MYYYLELTPKILEQIEHLMIESDQLIESEKLLLGLLDSAAHIAEYNRSQIYLHRYIEFYNFLSDLKEYPILSPKQYIEASYFCTQCSSDFRAVLDSFKACEPKTSPSHKMNISISTAPLVKSYSQSAHIEPKKKDPRQSIHYLAMYNSFKTRGIFDAPQTDVQTSLPSISKSLKTK